MIHDFEQELTTAAGQLFAPGDGSAAYGSIAYDMKGAGIDPAVGDPLVCTVKVDDADSDVGTSLQFQLVACDDTSKTNEVVLADSGAVVVANLTRYSSLALSADLGKCGAATRYMYLKVTQAGANATAGKIKAWVSKASDAVPANGVYPALAV